MAWSLQGGGPVMRMRGGGGSAEVTRSRTNSSSRWGGRREDHTATWPLYGLRTSSNYVVR